ncbi:MAG: hypothetical protein BECKG1743D_GA0114223_106412 [Candidatus Kentron sp. G]|nr:MAG: hypothetical protein BECKG1743E_GA0114224_106002 [Candidatus Kentron sp. G]VFN04866.1 MAG: hypothetical protein BECKG1743D_GA0114223_106412 [Candidatus Kentron sp. G]VFN05163.1 MAG: hypothetical protein BECKG1743F_GA0114225_110342 [Candidatus Kentron sp. G]
MTFPARISDDDHFSPPFGVVEETDRYYNGAIELAVKTPESKLRWSCHAPSVFFHAA